MTSRMALLTGAAMVALLIGAPSVTAGPIGKGIGTFHADCASSHVAADDPIVFPGQPGASHPHEFFGNRQTNAFTFPAQLRWNPDTNCEREGGKSNADASAYWVPALYVGNSPIAASTGDAYYSADFRDVAAIRPYPSDLEVIAGDSTGRTGPFAGGERIFLWRCAPGQTLVPATPTTAPTCRTPVLHLDITFPDCWDGFNSDSPNHKSHMAYSQPAAEGRACPASHPVLVPKLKLGIRYPTTGGPGVRLSSGGINTAHADFMNGWDPSKLATLVRACLNADKYCGGSGAPVPRKGQNREHGSPDMIDKPGGDKPRVDKPGGHRPDARRPSKDRGPRRLDDEGRAGRGRERSCRGRRGGRCRRQDATGRSDRSLRVRRRRHAVTFVSER
jgi:hypothetical protein